MVHFAVEDFHATRARIGDEGVAGGGAIGADFDGAGCEAGVKNLPEDLKVIHGLADVNGSGVFTAASVGFRGMLQKSHHLFF